jgi:predicted RNA-binding protein with PIN domain
MARIEQDAPAPDIPEQPLLIEPVRQRLINVASEVLGRLAPDDVPPALRGIARFTPAKRARLGATALAAALDADETFRTRVADVVAEASTQLVEALRSGAPTAASDPIDTAVVAYLMRPAGWPAILAEATAQWSAEHVAATDSALRVEIAALRDQIAALSREARGSGERERTAVARAREDSAAEIGELRGRTRSLSAQLQAAQHSVAEAQRSGEENIRRLETEATARDAELRRARSRITELERAVEAARRGARVARDIDDARLWLLVDTLTEAASGIRRELSLPPPTRRPADVVAGPGPAVPDRRYTDDPAALDRLLALPHPHLIVDGYNVTKAGYPALPLAGQRTRLIAGLAGLSGQARVEITLAFDGGERPPAAPATPRGVRVLFSAATETADDLIRRLVSAEPDGRPIVVVTSDQQVQRDVQRAGAWAVPSAVLLRRLGQS